MHTATQFLIPGFIYMHDFLGKRYGFRVYHFFNDFSLKREKSFTYHLKQTFPKPNECFLAQDRKVLLPQLVIIIICKNARN